MKELRSKRDNLMGELSILKYKENSGELSEEQRIRKTKIIRSIMELDIKLENAASQIY